MRFLRLLSVLWLLLFAMAIPARADTYKTHYDLAMALYQAQKFDEAVPEFKAAYEIDHKPGLLFNIAQSYRKAGRPREAILYYDQYLSAEPRLDTDTRHKVDGYLAEAKNTLAALELELKQRLAEEKANRATERPTTFQPEPAPATVAIPTPLPQAPNTPMEQPLYKRWWLWTAVGIVVVGGAAIGVAVGVSSHSTAPVVPDGVPRATITF